MSEVVKIWLMNLIDGEIEQVSGAISNETLWAKGSDSTEQSQMHVDNLADLEEYKALLNKMKDQVEKGEFPV